MVSAEEKPDRIADMLAIDNEAERGQALPDAELNVEPPPDKAALERDEAGKFKGKDGEKPPADKEAPKAEAKAEDKPKETVPLATFLEKTNKLKADLEAKDITIKQFETRMAALEAKLAPKAEVAAAPDFVEDPKGYVDHKQAELLKKIAEANEKAAESGKQAKETADKTNEHVQLQAFMGDLQKREQAFVAQNPDYYDALAHIRTVRAAQLREFNPDITDDQIRQAIGAEEIQMAVNLQKNGRDPLQTALNLAKHYGYQKKVTPPPAAGADKAAWNSAAAAKLPDAPNKLPPDQTLGAGAGDATEDDNEGKPDPIDDALASLFPRRRSA